MSGVTHSYGLAAAPAVHDLSLQVPAGAITTVLGPSGSGKSTLLALIAGIEVPRRGQITIGGIDVTRIPAADRGVTLVMQQPYLFPNLSVGDNVTFGLAARGMPRRERAGHAEQWLERVGLSGMAGRRPRELSGGEQQRVSLVRGLAIAPTVLLLDEPLASLDPQVRESLQRLLREIVEESGVTTVMVTHDRTEAMAMGDRTALLEAGALVAEGPSQTLFERPPTRVAATLLGITTFFTGVARDGAVATPAGTFAIDAHEVVGPVTCAIRSEHVRVVSTGGPNTLDGVVVDCTYRGEFWEITVDTPLGAIRARSATGRPRGDRCAIRLDPEQCFVVDDPTRP